MSTKKFGAELKRIREASRDSAKRIAKRGGISPTYMSHIEQEKTRPPGAKIIARMVGEFSATDASYLRALALVETGQLDTEGLDLAIASEMLELMG